MLNRTDRAKGDSPIFADTKIGTVPDQHADDCHLARPMDGSFIQPLPVWKRALDVAGALWGWCCWRRCWCWLRRPSSLPRRVRCSFRQRRSGLGGKEFTMLKFRSMTADAEARKQQLLSQKRAGRAGVQDQERSARDAVGPLSEEHQHRRVAATLERAPRRDVAGRSAAAALRRDGRLSRLAPPPPGRYARPDLPLAGSREI